MTIRKYWINQHRKDPFVLKAKKEGLYSRAAYKLIEIQNKTHLIKPGMTVLELGAAPGGWTQIIHRYLGKKGRIIAVDRLTMKSTPLVEFIQGDITQDSIIDSLSAVLKNQRLDAVLSDTAPNLSGQKTIDQPRIIYLIECAWLIVQKFLKKDGVFLFKLFQGAESDILISELRPYFHRVKHLKPTASRSKSREIYILADGFHLSKH
jgi:23S rRNA (uridine2552-2'-O)-methyltransferase